MCVIHNTIQTGLERLLTTINFQTLFLEIRSHDFSRREDVRGNTTVMEKGRKREEHGDNILFYIDRYQVCNPEQKIK